LKVVIVGAGIIGACTAWYAAKAGLEVTVVDRGPVAGGTTSRGEGNILLSDKAPGAELDLAMLSRRLWTELGAHLGAEALELESKGGLVVASTAPGLALLHRFAAEQAGVGVVAETVGPRDLARLEPRLAPGLPGGVHYPQDAQVQPVLAAARILEAARALGVQAQLGDEVVAARIGAGGAVAGVVCRSGTVIEADAVVNAAGTWGSQVGALLGAPVEILPRRGFILVTEPVPAGFVRHKVYSADYVANVAASGAGLETSVVVESTRGGTVLIGASRERVGFDATMAPDVVTRLAAQACSLFPALREVSLIRVYRGFRPYCRDHLPVIGPDPRVHGVLHACGHEGAGIGLAPGTGALVTAHLTGDRELADRFAAFRPDRLLGPHPDQAPPRAAASGQALSGNVINAQNGEEE
jgi:glycine/D-amino acid oxidase-like deaminating enzyme